VVSFKVDAELLRRLDRVAELEGVTRSEVIRRAVELYVRIKERVHMLEPAGARRGC